MNKRHIPGYLRNCIHLASITFLVSFSVASFADEGSADQGNGKIVEAQSYLSDSVLKTAAKLDDFFSNERNTWTQNKTRVTLRGNADWIDHGEGWNFGGEAKIFLALPGIHDRLRLVANDDDDEDGSTDSASSDDQDRTLALRWIGSASAKHGVSYDLGIASRDGKLQGFVRGNFFRHYNLGKTWDGRTANRLYYYADAGWRNDFRQYFERRLSDKLFFRSRTRVDYQEDKLKQAYPEQKFTLFQQVSDRSAIAWDLEAKQYCACDPIFDDNDRLVTNSSRYNLIFARARFRQNVFYPWLFYEVWPTASFPEERDYEFTAAIRLRIEVVLGDPPKGKVKLDE